MLQSISKKLANSHIIFVCWSILAAFGAYFCMYAFRKPFNNGLYEGLTLWGLHYKSVLIIAQVMGYMMSKFIGIKVISELKPQHRKWLIVSLIAVGQMGLILLGLIPYPYNFVCLFINGLPLGMVWGVIFSYLEGRRFTELIAMGLTMSQIIASGSLKTIYFMVKNYWPGVDQFWLPALIGFIFFPLFLFFTWMLSMIPPPSGEDIALRRERLPMTLKEKKEVWKMYAIPLVLIIIVYCFVSTLRDFRDSFSVEIWGEISPDFDKIVFIQTETISAIILFIIIGLYSFVKGNRLGFQLVSVMIFLSILISGGSSIMFHFGRVSPFVWMQLVGLGLFMGYMPLQIVFFDRFIALFNVKSNAGFFVYTCDSIGYLGSVVLLFIKDILNADLASSKMLIHSTIVHLVVSTILFSVALWYLYRFRSQPMTNFAHE